VRALRRPKLLTGLCADAGVRGGNDSIAKDDVSLALKLLHHAREVVLLCLPLVHPRGEVAHLPVETVVGKEHLGTDGQDLGVEADDAAVEALVAMLDRHANICEGELVCGRRGDQSTNLGGCHGSSHRGECGEGSPSSGGTGLSGVRWSNGRGVCERTLLEEVVEAAIAGDLQLLDWCQYLVSSAAKSRKRTGPTRSLAPAALAFWILSMMRATLPSHCAGQQTSSERAEWQTIHQEPIG
jgi:hypothetical protein